MKSKLYLLALTGFIFSNLTFAQDNYIDRSHDAYHTWLRLQTLSQNDGENYTFPGHGQVSNKEMIAYFQHQRLNAQNSSLSNVDHYNISKTIATFPEYYTWGEGKWNSRRPVGPFYKDEIDFLRVHEPSVFFNLNPIVSVGAKAQGDEQQFDAITGPDVNIGLAIRANYKKKIDLKASYIYSNESLFDYEKDFYNDWEALPGWNRNEIKLNNGRLIGNQFRAGLQFSIFKDYLTGSIGYDSHQYGKGMRSLFLLDDSAPYLYAKLSTKVWKLKYDNLFAKITPQFFDGENNLGGHKYFTAHHLSLEIFPWWNIGLFESVTFSREKGYEAAYLNPIIFYRSLERSLGSPDKISLGVQTEFYPVKNLSLYGQFLLNEFTAEYFFKRGSGYWANKWGAQAGLLYTNVATVNNLDLQLEANFIRPYTYTHSEKDLSNIANYSNGNLPLAHTLGAGFMEFLVQLNYQPLPKLSFKYQSHFYKQGQDEGNENRGNNIFKSYQDNKPSIFGVTMIYGPEKEIWQQQINASYEIKANFYVDLGGYFRIENNELNNNNSLYQWGAYTRFRLNLFKDVLSKF